MEVHTVPHFKSTINFKVDPEGLECDGIFISHHARSKIGHLLHKTGFVHSDMHTTVVNEIDLFQMRPGYHYSISSYLCTSYSSGTNQGQRTLSDATNQREGKK